MSNRYDAIATDHTQRRLDADQRHMIDDGGTMEPSVSVPTAKAARLARHGAAEPELEPLVLRSSAIGVAGQAAALISSHWVNVAERILAHSLRLVFPRMTAPAARCVPPPSKS